MNVFDDEAIMADHREAERIAILAQAGVTLEECRAYSSVLFGVAYV